MKNIIALVDFTRASEVAIAQGGKIARAIDGKLTMLHVAADNERNNEEELISELNVSAEVLGNQQMHTELHVEYGDFHAVIADLLIQMKADLVLIGTHGIRGIQRNLFSKNIASLLRGIKIPAMVIQGQREQSPSNLRNWLLVNVSADELTTVEWLKISPGELLVSKKNNVEEVEEEAFKKDCNLIVYKGDGEKAVDLVLNSFGIPVLLL